MGTDKFMEVTIAYPKVDKNYFSFIPLTVRVFFVEGEGWIISDIIWIGEANFSGVVGGGHLKSYNI